MKLREIIKRHKTGIRRCLMAAGITTLVVMAASYTEKHRNIHQETGKNIRQHTDFVAPGDEDRGSTTLKSSIRPEVCVKFLSDVFHPERKNLEFVYDDKQNIEVSGCKSPQEQYHMKLQSDNEEAPL